MKMLLLRSRISRIGMKRGDRKTALLSDLSKRFRLRTSSWLQRGIIGMLDLMA